VARDKSEELQPEETDAGQAAGEEQATVTDKELAEQYLANWQRAQADFINFKKRAEQEKADFARYANGTLMASILPVLDDFERALENIPEDARGSGWVEGIELIYRKLLGELESQGLSRLETEGADFDPNFHQAVLHEEGEEGKVIEELQKGYMLHDRLLRPAMVKVGKGEGETGSGTIEKQE